MTGAAPPVMTEPRASEPGANVPAQVRHGFRSDRFGDRGGEEASPRCRKSAGRHSRKGGRTTTDDEADPGEGYLGTE